MADRVNEFNSYFPSYKQKSILKREKLIQQNQIKELIETRKLSVATLETESEERHGLIE
jgi:hypothetical protein